MKDIFVAKINRQYGQNGSRSARNLTAPAIIGPGENLFRASSWPRRRTPPRRRRSCSRALLGIDLDQWRQTNDPEAERLYYLPEAKCGRRSLELKGKDGGSNRRFVSKGKGYMTTADNQAIEDSKKGSS